MDQISRVSVRLPVRHDLLVSEQVMKMVLTLAVEESGVICYVKRPGTVLETGCVVARLQLDDPTKVRPVSGICWKTISWLSLGPNTVLLM